MNRSNGKQHIQMSMAATHDTTVTMSVTPEMATRWLAQNTESQRPVSAATVAMYAKEMSAGRWALTHQGIAFNRSGELVDGQHRLRAVVCAGVAIPVKVTTGLVLEYNSPLDTGYTRTFSHLLGKSRRHVSCVRAAILLATGLYKQGKVSLGDIQAADAASGADLVRVDALLHSTHKIPVGVVAAMAFALPIDVPAVEHFAEQLYSGEMLQRGMPAYTLRNWLSAGHRPSSIETLIGTLSALRAHIEKRPLRAIYSLGRASGGFGTSGEGEGMTNYEWVCARRRRLGLAGTPPVLGTR